MKYFSAHNSICNRYIRHLETRKKLFRVNIRKDFGPIAGWMARKIGASPVTIPEFFAKTISTQGAVSRKSR